MTSNEDPRPAQRFVCRSCGSPEVECLDWVDANTDEFVGGNDSPGSDSTWCRSCEGHHGIRLSAMHFNEEHGS